MNCQKIRKRCIRQEFQRDKAAQHCVFGLVDHPHAAATELFHDPVV
jgi:hypothetical protein